MRAMPADNPATAPVSAPATPAGLETTALAPGENKLLTPATTAAPTAPVETVKVVLLQHYDFEGQWLKPNDEATLPAHIARTLLGAQWAKLPD